MLVLLLATRALAWPADSAWVALTQGGAEFEDPANDHDRDGLGLPDGIDCVGDVSLAAPALYWYTDGAELDLRVRVDDTPWLTEGTFLLPNDWSFLLETDGDDSNFEYVVAATGATPTVYLYRNGDGETGLTATPESLVGVSGASYTQASDAGSNIHTVNDWFVDVRLDLSDLPDGFSAGSTFRVAMVTGASTTPIGADADLCGTDDSASIGDLPAGWSDAIGIDQDEDGLLDLDEDALGTAKDDSDSDDDGVSDGDEVNSYGTSPSECDTDGDGLSDGLELGVTTPSTDTDVSAGCFVPDGDSGGTTTEPNAKDTDAGGLDDNLEDRNLDGVQGAWETDPNDPSDDADGDADGIADALEDECGGTDTTDRDGDGIPDSDEGFTDTDGDGIPDFCEPDDDDDGVPSVDEGGGDPTVDSDNDGTPDVSDPDSDNDGTPDGEQLGDADCDGVLDAYDQDDTDGECADPDGDSVTNADETACGSDPTNPDTDGDGLLDGDESCDDDTDCDQLPDRLDAETDTAGCAEPIDTAGVDTAPVCADGLCDGAYTGGSCSTGGSAASLFGAVLAAGLVTRRRRKSPTSGTITGQVASLGAASLLAFTPSVAHADPTVNAQRFHPAFESDTFFSVHDTRPTAPGVGGGLVFNYAASPLEYRYDDPAKDPLQLLGSVATLDAGLSYASGGFALAADLPFHLADGDRMDSTSTLGDLRVNAMGQIMDRTKSPLGLSIFGDVTLPTGDGAAWVGSSSPELGAGVGMSWGAKVVVSANLGMQIGAPASLGDLGWGSRFQWGAGLAIPVAKGVHIIGELEGESALASVETLGASPIEWHLGGKAHLTRNLVLTAAGGTGLTDGIGAPAWRAIAGITWVPSRKDAGAPHGNDRDGDGIVDAADLCPDQPEDKNGIADEDGCPDAGLVPTHFVVADGEGKKLAGASVELLSGPEIGRWAVPDGDFTRSLAPGDYQVKVRAPHYLAQEVTVAIPDAPRHEKVFQLEAAPVGGTLIVTVQNGAGQPVAALVTLLGEGRKFTTGPDGIGTEAVPAGKSELSVWAESYRPQRVNVTVDKDQKQSITVVLDPSRVVVLADRVDIRDKVFFDLDSATIKAESYRILDDVAATLDNHAELRLVEVQGHTDDQGAEDYNQELSQRRAEAVRKYLIGQGIEPDRLVARGYGEGQPLQAGTTEEAREVNRRVVFHILAGPVEDGPMRRGPKNR